MSKFVKKPIEIEALEFTGDIESYFIIVAWWDSWNKSTLSNNEVFEFRGGPQSVMLINTLEGWMMANPGDWIIRGIKDEVYPCKPDIFESTYDKVV